MLVTTKVEMPKVQTKERIGSNEFDSFANMKPTDPRDGISPLATKINTMSYTVAGRPTAPST